MRAARLVRLIISGEKKGLAASLVRGGLGGMSVIYQGIIFLRNWAYDWGFKDIYSLPARVISVGNITTGGTGKTPMVVWICRYLQGRGVKVAVLTRGYRADQDGENDEVRVLRAELPGIPIVIDADRVRGGRKAIRDYQADVLVMDDGFQHRQLQRDLDVVLVDVTCPFGYGRMLPAGMLREPKKALRRADVVILTRTEQVGPDREKQICQEIVAVLAEKQDIVIAESQCRPIAWYAQSGKESPEKLGGKKVLAVAGIGNPGSFLTSLRQLGAITVGQELYEDHHHYTAWDRAYLIERLTASGADFLVTTQKDWVKLVGPEGAVDPRWGWLNVETVISVGQEAVCRQLDGLLRGVR